MPYQLSQQDIDGAVAVLGCDEAALKAVMEVEASGSGFDKQGRPTMLFEPAVFERMLRKKFSVPTGAVPDWLASARAHGVCAPKWDRTLYPKTADGRWEQLQTAIKFDRDIALCSASFGLGQVMGSNYALAGFERVTDYVDAVCRSEGQQLLAMSRFILANSAMNDALVGHDWGHFAKLYNGPLFAQNQYDTRLDAAFQKHDADPEAFWRERASYGRAEGSAHVNVFEL